MGNTRIRYAVNDNLLVSKRVFPVAINGADYTVKVVLNTETMTYSIYDAADESKMFSNGGKTSNLSILKIQAKDALKGLGYEFGSESRDRGDN